MTEQEAINVLKMIETHGTLPTNAKDEAIKALEEIQQYRSIGTPEEIKQQLSELERWHTTEVNPKIKNVFANTSTQICHNCDHKDEYIEELEAETEEYRVIGTPEECRAAVEKQTEKKPIPYKPWAGKCPMCSVIFTSNLTNYCGNCGQKLDWSDVE